MSSVDISMYSMNRDLSFHHVSDLMLKRTQFDAIFAFLWNGDSTPRTEEIVQFDRIYLTAMFRL